MTLLQKLPKNVGDLGKLIVAKGFKSSPKSNKSANYVTLLLNIKILKKLFLIVQCRPRRGHRERGRFDQLEQEEVGRILSDKVRLGSFGSPIHLGFRPGRNR